MNTITFDPIKAQAIELAVCKEFECPISVLVNFRDTFEKKVVVFLLSKHCGYDKRILGHKYQMTYLYVPTVVSELEYMLKIVPGLNNKINAVLKQIDNEKILDTARNRNLEAALS